MKQILFSLGLFISVSLQAQQLKVKDGQKITITSIVDQDIDMGVGQIKNNTTTLSSLEIKNSDEKNVNAVFKVEKIQISMDAMGQQQTYDSEKPGDKDSEIGKTLQDKLGREMKLIIDKKTGKAESGKAEIPAASDKEDDNPMASLSKMFGAADTESAVAEAAIFIIPAGKKIGESWTDSIGVKDGMKGFRTYTIKGVKGDETTVAMVSKIDGSQNVEMQGMQMVITISAKTEGQLLVNNKTSLMMKSNRVADISGTMDVMGQSMPLTSKVTESTEYK